MVNDQPNGVTFIGDSANWCKHSIINVRSRPETFDKHFMVSVRVSVPANISLRRIGFGLPVAVKDPYPFKRQSPDS
ncbi:hypothetical protein LL13F56_30220 [Escherichia coli]